MRLRTSILLVVVIGCAQPPSPTIPPVTSAHPEALPPLTESKAATKQHPMRAKLETVDAELFLLHRSEKGASCERATVKAPDKDGKRALEINASSPIGCWSGKALVHFTIDGDHADVSETHVLGSYMGAVTRCVAPRSKGEPVPANVETVSDAELKIEGTRVFGDEASCKSALAANDTSPAPTGCLAKGLSSAVGARRPPPAGAFVDRFEKLIKGGGTVYVPSETQKNVCVANQVTSKATKEKDKDVQQVTLTTTSVEQGTRWVDKADYIYEPTCKRLRFAGFSGEGKNPDGSTSGRTGSTIGNAYDLAEQEDTKDALPISGPVFYSQNACVAWMRSQGTASSK